MKLIINQEVQSSTIPVEWCIEPLEAEEISRAKNPRVLIVVRPAGTSKDEEDRYLIEIDAMKAFIPMCRPGISHINARIVATHGDKFGDLHDAVFSVEKGNFKTDLLSYAGDEFVSVSDVRYVGDADNADVSVPAELFGKAWPKWVEYWVNLFRSAKPENECSRRKRALWAFFVQPLYALPLGVLNIAFKLIVWFFAVCFGHTGFDAKAFFHPWNNPIPVLEGLESYVQFRRYGRGRARGTRRNMFFPFAFMPCWLLIACAFIYYGQKPLPVLLIAAGAMLSAAALLFLAGICNLYGWWGVERLWEWPFEQAEKLAKKLSEKRKQARRDEFLERVDSMLCTLSPADFTARFNALTLTQRVSLFVGNLKVKVCRPLAQ